MESWDCGVWIPSSSRRISSIALFEGPSLVKVSIYGYWKASLLYTQATSCLHLFLVQRFQPALLFTIPHPTFLSPSLLAPLTPGQCRSPRSPGRRPTLGNMVTMLLKHSRRFSSSSFCLFIKACRRRSCRWSVFSRKM